MCIRDRSDTSTDFGKLISAMTGGKSVDLIMDGIFNPEILDEEGRLKGLDKICFRNNGDVSFINLNGGKGTSPEEMAQNMTNDISEFNCELETIPLSDIDKWLAVKE